MSRLNSRREMGQATPPRRGSLDAHTSTELQSLFGSHFWPAVAQGSPDFSVVHRGTSVLGVQPWQTGSPQVGYHCSALLLSATAQRPFTQAATLPWHGCRTHAPTGPDHCGSGSF